ncbi:hypothetical protein CTA2_11348 [Colletotrichum tanaceti]|uniref:Uncharacterized protein n=1 Tax=Colletotrichum tanaceti TaxID=1306861 RepID=A0A4U6XC37_9PEZI|nr:hypothetical protein CTA2_11348 [Colletotrichum tanaceti]TKW52719.1 hypothetical protein CTA1_5685 [Colletotrichum tanaceti]
MRPAAFNQIALASLSGTTTEAPASSHFNTTGRRQSPPSQQPPPPPPPPPQMGLQRPSGAGTHVSVMILRAIGDLPAIIWEVLAGIAWEGWASITNQLRLLMATYPLMVILYFSTSGFDFTTAISTCCVVYLYASFLYYFRLKDRLPWACLAATFIWFDGPDRQLMRHAAVAVFMLARDSNWRVVVDKRVRRQTLPWQDGSGFEFLYNFEGRELLRDVCLYWVNTLCSSFGRHRVPDDFALRTSVRAMDVLVLPILGLVDWAWRYRRARNSIAMAEMEKRRVELF